MVVHMNGVPNCELSHTTMESSATTSHPANFDTKIRNLSMEQI